MKQSFPEMTEKLARQFSDAEVVEGLIQEGQSREEVIIELVARCAVSFGEHSTKTPGQEVQFLIDWHRSLKADCSYRFQALASDDDGASREELKSDPDLVMLNAIRRGVKRAMTNKQYRSFRRI